MSVADHLKPSPHPATSHGPSSGACCPQQKRPRPTCYLVLGGEYERLRGHSYFCLFLKICAKERGEYALFVPIMGPHRLEGAGASPRAQISEAEGTAVRDKGGYTQVAHSSASGHHPSLRLSFLPPVSEGSECWEACSDGGGGPDHLQHPAGQP